MGLRFYKQIQSKNYGFKNTEPVMLEIFDAQFNGTAIEIEAIQNVSVSIGQTAEDIYNPIIQTNASISIVDTGQIDFTELFTPDAKRFNVKLTSANWNVSLFIVQDSAVLDMSYMGINTITAIDNLSYLDTIDYEPSSSFMTIGSVLAEIVSKTGNVNAITYDNTAIVSDGLPFQSWSINTNQFNGVSCYVVLESILKSVGATIQLVNGSFRIQTLSRRYDSSKLTANKSSVISQASGTIELVPAHKEIKVIQALNPIDNYFEKFPQNDIKKELSGSFQFNNRPFIYTGLKLNGWRSVGGNVTVWNQSRVSGNSDFQVTTVLPEYISYLSIEASRGTDRKVIDGLFMPVISNSTPESQYPVVYTEVGAIPESKFSVVLVFNSTLQEATGRRATENVTIVPQKIEVFIPIILNVNGTLNYYANGSWGTTVKLHKITIENPTGSEMKITVDVPALVGAANAILNVGFGICHAYTSGSTEVHRESMNLEVTDLIVTNTALGSKYLSNILTATGLDANTKTEYETVIGESPVSDEYAILGYPNCFFKADRTPIIGVAEIIGDQYLFMKKNTNKRISANVFLQTNSVYLNDKIVTYNNEQYAITALTHNLTGETGTTIEAVRVTGYDTTANGFSINYESSYSEEASGSSSGSTSGSGSGSVTLPDLWLAEKVQFNGTKEILTDVFDRSTDNTKHSGTLAASGDVVAYEAGSEEPLFPVATKTSLGVVKIGENIEVSADGTISAQTGSGSTTNWDDIQGKPAFATVSTTGSYNDLTNTPTVLPANGGVSDFSGLLKPVGNTTSTTSVWNPKSFSRQAWGQAFLNVNIINNDTGDLTLWLRRAEYVQSGAELCMFIDGDYYAGTGQYKVWHEGNCNRSDVSWNASTLYISKGNIISYYGAFGSRSYVWNESDTSLCFGTSNKERMTILPNGNIGIGSDQPASKLFVNGKVIINPYGDNVSNNYNEGIRLVSASNQWSGVHFGTNSTSFGFQLNQWLVGKNINGIFQITPAGEETGTGIAKKGLSIETSGNVTISGNLTTTGENNCFSTSDKRLKQDVNTITKASETVNKLRPVTFRWNDRAVELNGVKNTKRNNFGVIAQELEEVLPELVHPIHSKYKGVDYEQLIPLLLANIQELNETVKNQGEIIATLQKK